MWIRSQRKAPLRRMWRRRWRWRYCQRRGSRSRAVLRRSRRPTLPISEGSAFETQFSATWTMAMIERTCCPRDGCRNSARLELHDGVGAARDDTRKPGLGRIKRQRKTGSCASRSPCGLDTRSERTVSTSRGVGRRIGNRTRYGARDYKRIVRHDARSERC